MVKVKGNPSVLNGWYANTAADVRDSSCKMWSVINRRPSGKTQNPDLTGTRVNLTVLNKHRVQAQLYADTGLVAEKILKGKTGKHYFSVRRRIQYIGLPVLFLKWSDFKFQMGVDGSKQLCLDYSSSQMAWILIAAGGHDEHRNLVYQPVTP